MLATDNFTMRISPREKKMLATAANHFHRSQADTIKTLVREVYEAMIVEKEKENQPGPQVHDILGE